MFSFFEQYDILLFLKKWSSWGNYCGNNPKLVHWKNESKLHIKSPRYNYMAYFCLLDGSNTQVLIEEKFVLIYRGQIWDNESELGKCKQMDSKTHLLP